MPIVNSNNFNIFFTLSLFLYLYILYFSDWLIKKWICENISKRFRKKELSQHLKYSRVEITKGILHEFNKIHLHLYYKSLSSFSFSIYLKYYFDNSPYTGNYSIFIYTSLIKIVLKEIKHQWKPSALNVLKQLTSTNTQTKLSLNN